jgi:hypothetical protein
MHTHARTHTHTHTHTSARAMYSSARTCLLTRSVTRAHAGTHQRASRSSCHSPHAHLLLRLSSLFLAYGRDDNPQRVFTTAVVAGGRATKRFATSRSTARSCDRICARVREQEDARRRQQRDEERDDCRSAVSKRKTQRDDTSLCREPTSIDDCQTQHTPAESRANWQPRTPHKAQLAPTMARVSAAVAASSSYRRRTAFFAAYRAPSCTNCEKFPFLQTRCGPSRYNHHTRES